MNKSQKYLLSLIFILFISIIIELFYLLSVDNSLGNKTILESKKYKNSINLNFINRNNQVDSNIESQNLGYIIHQDFLKYLSIVAEHKSDNKTVKYYYVQEANGELMDIERNTTMEGMKTPFCFVYKNNEYGPKDIRVCLSQDLYDKTSFYFYAKNGKKDLILSDEVKKGYKFSFTEKNNLYYSPSDNRHTDSGEFIVFE
jgi:hypothetical protein